SDLAPGAPRWSAEPSGVADDLAAVWGSGASDVFAVGANGRILHSTGAGAWTPRASGRATALTAVWGNAASDVFIAAADGATLHSDDGASFTAAGATAATPFLGASRGDDVLAATMQPLQLFHSTDHGLHYTVVQVNVPTAAVGPETLFAPGGPTVFGAGCFMSFACQALRSDDSGATWNHTTLMTGGAGHVYPDVVAIFSRGDDVYILINIVGPDSAGSPVSSYVVHSADGGASYKVGTAMMGTLGALWSSEPGDLWLAGDAGLVAHSTDGGMTLARVTVPSAANLRAVWGSAADDVYAVGAGGAILHFHR